MSPVTINCPENQQASTDPGQTSTRVYYPSATAHDDSGDNVTIRYSIPSGAVFNLGQTPVKVTAVASIRKQAFGTFIVEVTQPGKHVIVIRYLGWEWGYIIIYLFLWVGFSSSFFPSIAFFTRDLSHNNYNDLQSNNNMNIQIQHLNNLYIYP